jgi:antitoxin HicB
VADFIVTDGQLVLRLQPAEEGGYVVTSPFNSDILTQAESLEEAFENARDVIALFEADRKAERGRKKKAGAR